MITVSNAAKEYIEGLMSKQPTEKGRYVRVGVRGGGCSGLEYQLEFDSEKKKDDEVFTDKDITILVDKKSLLYLFGTELDYSSGLNGKGLFFNNPNATRTCSCGESFAV
ncbi:HesB/IscA family protein [Arachidicoccus sp.]|jgi:iron-sulfur cluster assembly protein|uniref:HesB/IscA family protein n=1 Tax=Arachidicoccus sp. TaxID=1872624 RepID=UPI003D19FA19